MATYDHEKLGAVTTVTPAAEPLCASMGALRTCVAAIVLSAALLSGAAAATHKGGASSASGEAATPPEIAEFMALLADPKVQKWLEEQQHAAKASKEPAPEEETVSQYVDARISATREHFVALGTALPELPNEFERAIGLVRAEIPTRGTVPVLVLVFAALGFGVEWLFRKATRKTRQRLIGLPMETVRDRLLLVAARFAFSFVVVVAFAIGSVGPFFALDWPPLLRQILLGYLVAVLVTRIAVVVGHFLLAPDDERFRIIPTDTVAARFWCRRLTAFVAWTAFGWVTLSLLSTLGFSLEERHLVGRLRRIGKPKRRHPGGFVSAGAHRTRCCRSASCCCGCSGLWEPCRASGSFWSSLPCRCPTV